LQKVMEYIALAPSIQVSKFNALFI